jgi:hypothetical protein
MSETIESLKASDLAEVGWSVCSAGEGATPYPWEKTIDWWLERWLKMSKGSDWVLRLEDDIVVGRYIGHNLTTWPAIKEPDFGMGLGFVFDGVVRDLGGVEFLPNKVVRAKARSFSGGQAQLMPSHLIPGLVDWISHHRNVDGIIQDANPVWFDTGITAALSALGYRTYLHVPSVVCTGSLSTTSAASNCERLDHNANRTWLADWERPSDYEKEFLSEMMLQGKRTRWAVLGDKSIVECSTPANLDPVAGPVTIHGHVGVLKSSCLYDSSAAARQALQLMK